jgi:ATP-binding cassette, subfamily B, bacterial
MTAFGLVDSTFPQLTRYGIDEIINPGKMENLLPFSMVYLGVIITLSTLLGYFIHLAGEISIGMGFELRKKSFEKLLELDLSYYDKNSSGQIVSRVTSDITKIWGIVDTVWGGCVTIFIIIFMFIMDYKVALLTLSVMPVLSIIAIVLQKKILTTSRTVRKLNSDIISSFNETIAGSKNIKLLNCKENNDTEFGCVSDNMKQQSIKSAIYSCLCMPVVIGIGSIGIALAIKMGGHKVMIGGISTGTLAAFISYLSFLNHPVRELTRVISEIIAAQAAAERVIELLSTESSIVEKHNVLEKYGSFLQPKYDEWPYIQGEVEFNNVCFSYDQHNDIFKNFTLKVQRGEVIAVIGETGAGKTTLVNLLLRFLEPDKGSILIDGVDYRERTQKWLHSNIGYVLQTPFIFGGTIKENITYGKPDANMTEIIEVSKACGLDAFIQKQQYKYDSKIGEGGINLSSGQKQLISIARIMLLNPSIVVLDEATSSIDTITEELVKESIKTLLKDRTSFIIAHRLSTIKTADRIIVIENGQLLEDGSHEELLSSRGRYYELYNSLTA